LLQPCRLRTRLACVCNWAVVKSPSKFDLQPRRGALLLAQGGSPVGGANPGYRPCPYERAPEGRTCLTIDLRGSPLRGSIIIVHPLPRVHADLKGRLPPWANHKASPRDSRRKTGPLIVRPSGLKVQNSARDNYVNLPSVCRTDRLEDVAR
jgi:hypothetical protein